jgi:acetolactate synthase-1/2/3 large subunit
VCITGQVPRGAIGSDAFQETDVTGVTLPVTKHNYLVADVEELAYIMREAFYIARSGRPGPVLVDVPKDVQTQKTEFVYPEHEIRLPGYRPPNQANSQDVAAALERVNCPSARKSR